MKQTATLIIDQVKRATKTVFASRWILLLTLLVSGEAFADGNWLALGSSAPGSVDFMLLLPDGVVMLANNPHDILGDLGNNWYGLAPDYNGHYVLGEWEGLPPMTYVRHAFASQVLTNGMVFFAGGEHPAGGAGGASAEVYDPVKLAWTLVNPPASMMDGTQVSPQGFNPPKNQGFLDCESRLLPNGNVLLAPVAPSTFNATLIYNPASNSWSQGPPSLKYQAEASWVGLPDGSILTIDPDSTSSERYIPSLNQWILDADVPVNVWASLGPKLIGEIGPAFLLPNGKAFFLGGNGHTAIYTPSGSTNVGSWVAGPDIPNGLAAADAPAAMMPNGRILCEVAPVPSGDNNGNPTFPTPTSFFEYDYSAGPVGAFTQVSGPTGTTDNIRPQDSSMLVLPDGSVLYCHVEEGNLFYEQFGSQLYVYVPIGSQVTLGDPVITSITPNADGSFHLTGTGLTGISDGAAFGDDAQMACNYPLVMFMDTNNGHVDYARSYNWTSPGVQTGSAVQSTEFALPPGLIPQTYLVAVSAAGVTSAPVTFSFVTPSTLSLCPGDSGTLSVITSPQPATYQWLFNKSPLPGQTNAELDIVSATTNQSGFYALKVKSGSGTYTSLPVQVSVGVWVIQPPPVTNSAALCEPFALSLLAQGKGPLTAHWFRNGNPVLADARIVPDAVPQAGGGTTLSLNFTEIKYEDDGTYTALITDACGSVTTAPFTMRVVPNPPWVQVATEGPPSRNSAAMCYDSDRKVTVLFGGGTWDTGPSGFLGDTWEFDGTNWARRLPTNSPVARTQANMVYDSQRHRTVLFGGWSYDPHYQIAFSPETWEWDGANWQQIITPHFPPWTDTLYPYAACYDSIRGEMLLFGFLQDPLWSYNGTDWTAKNVGGALPQYSVDCTAMAFDSNRGVAVLPARSSVYGAGNYFNWSMWEWDGAAWHERPQSGQQPDLMIGGGAVLTYDTFRQECVLFGQQGGVVDGKNTTQLYPYPDFDRFVWRWNGQQWQADPPTPTFGVSTETYHSMCFDSARNALILFGGSDGTTLVTNYTYEILYQDSPAVLKQPEIQSASIGQPAQISVVAVGAPSIGYQWQKGAVNLPDGGRISGSTSTTLTIADAVPGDSGYYQISMTNQCGMAVSQPILLNVTAGPSTIAVGTLIDNSGNGGGVNSGSTVITWGDSSTILQTSTNASGPWIDIPGATSPYTISPVMPNQFYRLFYP